MVTDFDWIDTPGPRNPPALCGTHSFRFPLERPDIPSLRFPTLLIPPMPRSNRPSTIEIAGVTLELVQGDITNQPDVDAIVNAANAQLRTGGGVAGAIHRAAGPGLAQETRAMAPIQPGEAVISGGHDLPNTHIIHVLGPVYGRDEPSNELLRAGYVNALRRAEEHRLSSIAFPALSTGAFGFPLQPAARTAIAALTDAMPRLQSVTLIRFVLFDDEFLHAHQDALATVDAGERDA